MSTNFHIDDIGNLILRDGKLGLSVSSQYVTPPHYGGGRVGALSLYAYCAGDPVNCVDPDGRDMENAIEGDNYLLSRKTQQIVKYSSSDSQTGERKDVQNNNNYNFL